MEQAIRIIRPHREMPWMVWQGGLACQDLGGSTIEPLGGLLQIVSSTVRDGYQSLPAHQRGL